ncbi:ABC transporter substrate-binding protein [Bdellovibrio sp. NC01]|uniref:substrate-binding periplasmic protein n=1 Tax=Bdellovibrio sp. NC01 TaxID=2220073 RepID=UPI00143D1E3E|nr:transporter substrate-binding domain-containing protein [Bdellovibrio sp. NC01]
MAVFKAGETNPGGVGPLFLNTFIFPEVEKKYDLKVVWDLSPTARLFKELANGNLDMMCFVARTSEREKIFAFSSVDMFNEAGGLVVRKDRYAGKDTITPQELAGKTIGQLIGTYVPGFYEKYKIKSFQVSGEDVPQRISDLVESKRVDGAYIHVHATAQYLVKTSNLKQLKAVKVVGWPPLSITVAYRKNIDPALKNAIDEALRKNKFHFDEMIKNFLK